MELLLLIRNIAFIVASIVMWSALALSAYDYFGEDPEYDEIIVRHREMLRQQEQRLRELEDRVDHDEE